MQTDTDVLHHCLENVALLGVDITPRVSDIFSARMPEADSNMSVMDIRMKGRMLDQIYSLLLGESDSSYLEFEARTHKGYGASPAMYRGILTAVRDAVKETLTDSWSISEESAWERSIEGIVSTIEELGSEVTT